MWWYFWTLNFEEEAGGKNIKNGKRTCKRAIKSEERNTIAERTY